VWLFSLKLENILIGQNFEVKLIDFGLTLIGENGSDPKDNKLNGTPYYMSP
jgi:serine/threonine protein kinase